MSTAASTLEELVAPLSEAEFLALLRERKLFHVRSPNHDRYTELMGWQALRRLLESGVYPGKGDHLRVAKESVPAPIDRWMIDGKADADRLEACLADGFSVIATHIEEHIPALAALCQGLTERLRERTYVGVIASTGAEGAFITHYDFEDLIILQVEGAKRWQIFGPPVSNPLRGMTKPRPPEGAPIFDAVLEAGDFLFVPAGNWHHCETMSSRSIHAGIFFIPPTGWHAAKALTTQLLTDELFRTPFTRIENAAQLAALEAEVKRRLIEKISAMSLGEFPAEWSRKRSSQAATPVRTK